jgi:regulator of replication initiation timing
MKYQTKQAVQDKINEVYNEKFAVTDLAILARDVYCDLSAEIARLQAENADLRTRLDTYEEAEDEATAYALL